MLLTPLLLFSAFSFAPAEASERYIDCLTLIEDDVERGRRAAQIWVDEGGGANARHCLAMADMAADLPRLAAIRLEEIAQRKDAGDDLIRARLYAQAAEAWIAAGLVDAALAALLEAEALAPESGELQLTAAMVYHAREEFQKVVQAVDAAEAAGFISVNAFVQRGEAHLALGANERAAYDVVAALSIDAKNIDALTLRGDVQRRGIAIDVALTPVRNVPAPADQ